MPVRIWPGPPARADTIMKDRKEYFRRYMAAYRKLPLNRERKRIWKWNKDHPDRPLPMPLSAREGGDLGAPWAPPSPDVPAPLKRQGGNDRWAELSREDEEWAALQANNGKR